MAKLEEAIKQSNFQSQTQKAVLNILYTSNHISESTTPFFKENGILQQHYNVLRIVRGKNGEPASPGQIIEVMLDKGRDLTRLVDKLVKLGYLRRGNSATNRRKVEIFITELGLEITEKISVQLTEFYKKLDIDEDQAQQINELLDKIRG